MTDLLNRADGAGPSGPEETGASGAERTGNFRCERRPSVVLAAVSAAVWAAAVGLIAIAVVVLLAWATDRRSTSPAAAALRTAADVWLIAQGAPIRAAGSTFHLIPLALTALPAYLLHRAGASVARTVGVAGLGAAFRATAAVALSYAVVAVVVTGPAAAPHARVGPLAAFLGAGLLATLCAGAGVLRESGRWRDLWQRAPEPSRAAVHGGVVAVAVSLAAATLLAGASLAAGAGEAGRVFGGLRVGVVGAVVLTLLSLAYLPNAGVYAMAFLAGPGFAVGSGTTVSPSGVRLLPVPALPLLAALPAGPVRGWVVGLMLVPVVGGVLAGVVVGRRQAAAGTWTRILAGAGSGAAAGALVGLLCLASAGSAGAARLSEIGPSAWRVALALTLEVGLPAMGVAWWVGRPGAGGASPAG